MNYYGGGYPWWVRLVFTLAERPVFAVGIFFGGASIAAIVALVVLILGGL